MRPIKGNVFAMAVLLAAAASGVSAEQSRAVYIVNLVDPPAVRFDAVDQVAKAKSLKLRPTSRTATGARRFDASSIDAQRYAAYLRAEQDAVLAQAGGRFKRAMQPRHRYQWLSNGFSLEMTAEEARAMAALPGVAGVQEDYKQQLHTDAGPQWIGAEALWNGTVPGSLARTRGEGIIVGVIDTGINAAHPAFADIASDGYNHNNPRGSRLGLCLNGGETRCNDKLIGIYDFVNEPNSQAGADIDGHGSHVASTAVGNPYPAIGANGPLPINLSGVAPRANLVMYKGCGTDDIQCPFSATNAALDRAVADGVDVINYSIGGPERAAWDGIQSTGSVDGEELFLNLREAGIVGVVSAGNEGPVAGSMTSPSAAPWVISAANITSNRSFRNVLENVTGTGVVTPQQFAGVGLTGALPQRPIVHARDFGDADCGSGTIDNPINPFPPGTFSGQIVICVRGTYARVDKGKHVQQSGAGGMILVNTALEGESVVADEHFLPAVHLGEQSGAQLQAIVEAARLAGGQLSGNISGATRVLGAGDALNSSSSRGPTLRYDGVMKPSIAAPGTGILAASHQQNRYAVFTGTSMAAPHIAGASALLLAAHPTWSVDHVETALLGTASRTLVLPGGTTPAGIVQGGAGRVDLVAAVRAGLHLRNTRANFVAANPQLGGDPRTLNLPGIQTAQCNEICSFARTVTDNGSGGSWQATGEANRGALVSVSPAQFTLAAGASQVLQISVDVRASTAVGYWIDGGVRLRASHASDLVLPVSVFARPGAVPEVLSIDTDADAGKATLTLAGLVALPDATFLDTSVAIVTPESVTLQVDTDDRNDAFNNSGAFRNFRLLSKPPGAGSTGRIYAESSAIGARVYIGRDTDGSGAPESYEVLCRSADALTASRCALDADWSVPGTRYWVLVHNERGSLTSTTIAVMNVMKDGDADTSLVVSGPRRIARQTNIPILVGWKLPQLRVGDIAMASIRIGADRNNVGATADIPLQIRRTAASTPRPIVLDGRGETLKIRLEPGQAHERMVIDIPTNAEALTVTTSGGTGEIDLYVAKATAGPTPPEFAPAPARGLAQGTSIHPGVAEEVVLLFSGSPGLPAGRWYVTPVNSGSSSTEFTLSASMSSTGAIPQPGDNAYRNPARSGHGVYLAKADSVWVATWYTYEANGAPVWYLASGAPPGPNDGVWSAPLLRFGWNGTTVGNGSFANTVGKVILTFDGSGGFTYSWLLNGEYGSEPMSTIAALGCPGSGAGQRSISGAWYAPDNGGWGLFLFAFPSGNDFIDANAIYVYDDLGNPRWLLAGGLISEPQLTVQQYTGFCPTCAFAPVSPTAVGTLGRTYATSATGTHTISANFVNQIPGGWNAAKNTFKLTRDIPCP